MFGKAGRLGRLSFRLDISRQSERGRQLLSESLGPEPSIRSLKTLSVAVKMVKI